MVNGKKYPYTKAGKKAAAKAASRGQRMYPRSGDMGKPNDPLLNGLA
jgi:hypothetical protein